jgi:hypothetical protein
MVHVTNEQAVVCALRGYAIFSDLYERALIVTKKVYDAVVTAFQPCFWVFFKDTHAPYSFQTLSLSAPGSLQPNWIYDSTNLRFIPVIYGELPAVTMARTESRKRLPLLSLEIRSKGILNSKCIYDLTDFIEKVRVCYVKNVNYGCPTVAQVIGAWSISSGVILDWSQDIFVNLINQDGDDYCVLPDKLHTMCSDFTEGATKVSSAEMIAEQIFSADFVDEDRPPFIEGEDGPLVATASASVSTEAEEEVEEITEVKQIVEENELEKVD